MYIYIYIYTYIYIYIIKKVKYVCTKTVLQIFNKCMKF
jgi:hypothetical protein